jgi:hypothetical protein
VSGQVESVVQIYDNAVAACGAYTRKKGEKSSYFFLTVSQAKDSTPLVVKLGKSLLVRDSHSRKFLLCRKWLCAAPQKEAKGYDFTSHESERLCRIALLYKGPSTRTISHTICCPYDFAYDTNRCLF